MKLAPLITLRSPEMVLCLSGAELTEVLGSLGHDVCEELELDSAEGFAWENVRWVFQEWRLMEIT